MSVRPWPSSLVLLVLAGGLVAACGAIRAPARSPLAEPPGTMAAAPTVPPVVTSVLRDRGGALPTAAEVEPAAARAASLLAEWLAVPQRELTVVAAEPVVWPSACLGLARPGETCADVQTAGVRVLLRDGLGGLHTVRAAAEDSGNARWAGEVTAQGVVVSLDRGAQRATVTVDGRALPLRLAPGSLVGPTVAAGTAVEVGYDPSGAAGGPPVAAWILPRP